MLSGFTLSYRGKKYDNNEDKSIHVDDKSGLERLQADFSEIGALVIRYHIGQGQRVGLIQQISRDDYSLNPVEKPAPGRDQSDVFSIPSNASNEARETRTLEEICHYSLGRGKVLNERAQPLVHTNISKFRGEQALWDIIHSPVWGTGINLSLALSKQGFLYIRQPVNMTTKVRNQVTQELKEKKYKLQNNKIITDSGITLETALFKDIKVDMDPQHLITSQENALIISTGQQQKPLGWIIQTKNKKMISPEHTDHVLRIIRIAKGGFYELSPEKQRVLQSGLLKNNGFGLFSQNQAFNAMEVVFQTLEKEYEFDPSQLLPSSALDTVYSRITASMEDKNNEIAEDYLTGILITEMVQPLKKTQPSSTRSILPLRFTNPFSVTLNNAKAIAYAFDLRGKDGFPLLWMRKDMPAFSQNPEFLDVQINGELLNPELTNPKHIASLLSTALLVTEQMLIEQLLRSACQQGDEHEDAIALKTILNNDVVYKKLIEMANAFPKDEKGPILGLQFTYCDQIVALLRETLEFGGSSSGLTEVIKQLYQGEMVDEGLILKINNVLEKLFNTGEILQQLNSTSVSDKQSRGVNAGLIPVIKKLTPDLYTTLVKQDRVKQQCDIKSFNPSEKASEFENPHINSLIFSEETDACPFLRPIKKEPSAVKKNEGGNIKPSIPTTKKVSQNSWCSYFARAIPIAVVIGAVGGLIVNKMI